MLRGPGFAELDLNAHAFSYVGRKVIIFIFICRLCKELPVVVPPALLSSQRTQLSTFLVPFLDCVKASTMSFRVVAYPGYLCVFVGL